MDYACQLEKTAFAAAQKLKAGGWSVTRGHAGGDGPQSCFALIYKGNEKYRGLAATHAEALMNAVKEVVQHT